VKERSPEKVGKNYHKAFKYRDAEVANRVPTLQTEKNPEFSRRNCRQYVEQMRELVSRV